jgi:hypothetical protein
LGPIRWDPFSESRYLSFDKEIFMDKAILTATVLVVGVTLAFGLPGALWCYALFFPIGIAIFLLGSALGWFR